MFMCSISSAFSAVVNPHTWVSRYQNVSILGFIGAKGDVGGGDNWSYKTCKAPVKSSLRTNQPTPNFLQALPVAKPTVPEY